ncbi:MAG: 3D domain-containing protein [Spirochaetes bacterium]|jgi:3D (Asp-Asp-Asp) domain-containing protein|nr:3D domain-containing protein [Spirochaetota bacterium]
MKREKRNSAVFFAVITAFIFITAGMSGCSKDEKTAKDKDKPAKVSGENSGSKTLSVTVYAYCPCGICNTNKWKGRVSSGQKMKTLTADGKNICAADPDVIPMGSTIEYDGKIYVVADIGRKIKGNTINILLDNHKDVYKFGVKKDQTITINAEE